MIEELDLIKKELKELKDNQAYMQSLLDEVIKPPNIYIRDLARECARGNWGALKAHNKRMRAKQQKEV